MEFIQSWEHFLDLIEGIHWFAYFLIFLVVLLIVIAVQDLLNKRQTIKNNYPIVGRLRYLIEKIGPELRQYIVANNREELPFNRNQRSWIYASAKQENNYKGFGTDQDIHFPGHIFVNPAMFPFPVKPEHVNHPFRDPSFVPCAKVMGMRRKRPFRPYSIVNVSAMSFGSLSAAAVTALNKGSIKAGCYHNTGEGSLSPYHANGADVIFHFGTGYFGCRNQDGTFSMEKLVDLVEQNEFIRGIEIKLSQGAKPGKGGVLPGKKITPEIARIRGVEVGKDVLSPAYHSAFSNVPELIEFVEDIGEQTGLPVGIKSAVGKLDMWVELANRMARENVGPDFITIDGGEGGTGAAPISFADNVALPFVYAFSEVYQVFKERGLADKVVFAGSSKLGLPATALKAFAMGVDVINVAREAMLAIGCIQAQICHTNKCPAGIATQKRWLESGLDPRYKSERFYSYVKTLRKEILEITHACGYEHPCQMTMKDVDVSMGDNNQTQTLFRAYGYEKEPVDFSNMRELLQCQYLGGQQALEASKKLATIRAASA